jgi:hypothetical protein
LVDTGDLKSPSEKSAGSTPVRRTTHSWFEKPSNKQLKQRKLWQAIGTVQGFNGYLINLLCVVKATDIDVANKQCLEQDIQTLQNRLIVLNKVFEAHIRNIK